MDHKALYGTYVRTPFSFVKGEGSWLETADGTRYLDFAAGIAVNSLGHCHPRLVEALTRQAGNLWHVSNLYGIDEQDALAERLCDLTFADRVFFTNSGAEAMECAMKTARRYQFHNGHPGRTGIIAFEGAFHGRTIATIAAAGNEKYLEGFGEPLSGFVHLPLGDIEAVKAAVSDETAAIMIEPIQGEGGIRAVSEEFLRELRAICDENGLLLIFDEVQAGAGRTGKLFAHEWAGISPDIMGIAKGIGSGFPLGACLATESAAAGMVPGTHGSTYGGGPLATAVGSTVLDVMTEDGFFDHVIETGLQLKQGLESLKDRYPDVLESVRGKGLMLGLKCRMPSGELVGKMRDEKLLGVAAAENVVRILPPLTVSREEIHEGLARLEKAVAALAGKAGKEKIAS